MTRRYGEAVKSGIRYKNRPGAYAILIRRGAVLLTHQAMPEPEFQLPGGGIDPGETPMQALHREVFEETGWTITGLRKIGIYRRFAWMPEYAIHAEKVAHVYLAHPTRQLGPPTEPGHDAVWTTPRIATGILASPGDRAFMARLL